MRITAPFVLALFVGVGHVPSLDAMPLEGKNLFSFENFAEFLVILAK